MLLSKLVNAYSTAVGRKTISTMFGFRSAYLITVV